jgi:nitrite reductase (NAD(P)H)
LEASHFASADHTNPVTAAIKRGDTQLAVYKVKGKYYATQQMCPHKRAFVLSDGLVGEDLDDGTPEGRKKKKMWVSCPYHKRNYTLSGGGGEGTSAGGCSNDSELSIATFQVEERPDGWVYLKLPSVAELDGLLGTERWKVKASEATDPFTEMDRKIVGSGRGRKSVKPEERGTNGDAVGVKTAGLEW